MPIAPTILPSIQQNTTLGGDHARKAQVAQPNSAGREIVLESFRRAPKQRRRARLGRGDVLRRILPAVHPLEVDKDAGRIGDGDRLRPVVFPGLGQGSGAYFLCVIDGYWSTV